MRQLSEAKEAANEEEEEEAKEAAIEEEAANEEKEGAEAEDEELNADDEEALNQIVAPQPSLPQQPPSEQQISRPPLPASSPV